MKFGSLFAGIGGMDLGFERAGMECTWQVEIDDYATKVLEKHWPHVHRERDVKNVGRHNLEKVDVIAAGFPCQDISYAGQGAGIDGERSGLFFEAIRVVCELRPRVVVLENVAALLTRGLDRVLGTLAEVGYDSEWHCIPARYVGAPHIRDRVFVLAYANGERGASGLAGQDIGKEGNTGFVVNESPEGCREKTRGGMGWWATEPSVGRVANGIPKRVDRLKGLGNAVVPQVAYLVANMILEKQENDAN